ncbi:MAG: hypothetical protein OK452_05195 [Thaumarchaeota archaeon]|nr:hypothetical protein [Nitrososphaerota archaeon]
MKSRLVVVVIAVIIMGGASTAYVAWSTIQHTSNSVTTSHSLAFGWTIIRTNLTVYYNTACVVIESSYLSCPTMDTASHSPFLRNVDLILYQGNHYYDVNFTYYSNGQPVTRTIWFTNSTVFCMSPMRSGYGTCPTRPAQQSVLVPSRSSTGATSPSLGLSLVLRLASDRVNSGSLVVTVVVHNSLGRVNNVSSANGWRVSTSSLRGAYQTTMVGYAVYRGTYGENNFTAGTPLALMEPGSSFRCTPCSPPGYYSFQPNGDNATMSPGSMFGYNGSPTMLINFTESISGFWTGPTQFDAFPAGTYTVVAFDQWGQTVAMQFTVQSTGNQ